MFCSVSILPVLQAQNKSADPIWLFLSHTISKLPCFSIAVRIHREQLDVTVRIFALLRSRPQRAISSGKKEGRIPPEGWRWMFNVPPPSPDWQHKNPRPGLRSRCAHRSISVPYNRHRATNRLVEWLMGARSPRLFNTRTHGSFIIPHQPNT